VYSVRLRALPTSRGLRLARNVRLVVRPMRRRRLGGGAPRVLNCISPLYKRRHKRRQMSAPEGTRAWQQGTAKITTRDISVCLLSHLISYFNIHNVHSNMLALQHIISCSPTPDTLSFSSSSCQTLRFCRLAVALTLSLYHYGLHDRARARSRSDSGVCVCMCLVTASALFGLLKAPSRGWAELFYSHLTELRSAAAHLRWDHRPPYLSGNRRPE
jgi:hypothetical protein